MTNKLSTLLSTYAQQQLLTMLNHGLFQDQPPPLVNVLRSWLDEHGVTVSDGVTIAPMKDGSGWRVVATRDLDPIETSKLDHTHPSL